MKSFIVSVIAITLGFTSGILNATIIDFEDVTLSGNVGPVGTQISRGFQFDTTSTNDILRVHRNGGNCAGGCVDNGTQALYAYNSDQTAPFEVFMTAVDNSVFNFLSFDYSELFKFTTDGTAVIDLIGTRSGGGTVTASFSIDQTPAAYQTATVSGFSSLTSVLFSSDKLFPTYDNIVVSSVPEPATLALMSLGLAGLGFSRKRKAA